MTRIRRWAVPIAGALLPLVAGVCAAPAASADPIGPTYTYVYSLKVTSTHTAAVKRSPVLATCSPGKGGTCSISKSRSVTRSIDLGLGASRGFVAGQLGWSKSASVTVTAQCTSPPATKSSQVYRAYAQGIKKRYTITKKTYSHFSSKPKLEKIQTTGGEAFNPKGVSCSLS
ncbi:hypothetical protein B0I32_121259 [Nonomuraea fuscirosea]|uniref:Uncharacterized protein n=1 Tax=Nonomuraea fuscirosea TaxID=1291556 RepID=A0A2T0MMU8_9ACTN|nr:hypothetical protein [Nonomuraea fuscirosea]PRX59155.1 hypothetical protein B0I32_121259 [Nonomuraea fuscirosea]